MKRTHAPRSSSRNLAMVLAFTAAALAAACTVDTGTIDSSGGSAGSGATAGAGATGGASAGTSATGGASAGTSATGGAGSSGGASATGGSSGSSATGGSSMGGRGMTGGSAGTGGSGGSDAAGTGGTVSRGGSAGAAASGGAGGSGGSDVPDEPYCAVTDGWDPAYAALEEEILAIVNQVRAQGATCGGEEMPPVGPLTMDASLQCAARAHSKDMADRDFFDHDNPDGDGPPERMEAAGYDGRNWGENIAAGRDTAEATMDQWMNSPGHCSNIMGEDYTLIGVGYYPGGEYGHLWTQTFGG